LTQGQALVAVAAELQPTVIEALDGWSLSFCVDGEEAIEQLWEGSPDLILLDFDLPRMTAYDVVRHLAMRRPELLDRTIVLVGPDENARALIQDVGVGRCLSRPVSLEKLAKILRAFSE
jgi:CheY-like chemotaxis protein